MLTDPLEILQAVIDHDGHCEDFANTAICKRCPLGNKRIDGRRVNCMDYLNQTQNVQFLSDDELADIYKAAAEEELFTIELENLLE